MLTLGLMNYGDNEMVNRKRYHIVKSTGAYSVKYIDLLHLCGFRETVRENIPKDTDEYHRLCKRCEKIANG